MISSFHDFHRKQDEKTIRPQEDLEREVGIGRKLLARAITVYVR
jgi:hypothetical protein